MGATFTPIPRGQEPQAPARPGAYSDFFTLMHCWRSGFAVVQRRGENFLDGSPKHLQPAGLAEPPSQGQGERPVGDLDPAACWAGVEAFFLLPAMQTTSTLLRSINTRQRKSNQSVRQLGLFSLPGPIACFWPLNVLLRQNH